MEEQVWVAPYNRFADKDNPCPRGGAPPKTAGPGPAGVESNRVGLEGGWVFFGDGASEGAGERDGSSPQGERRRTTVEDAAVQKIAGIAAQGVEKAQMGGVTGAVTGGDSSGGGNLASGVSAEVGEEAAFDLALVVEYGVSTVQVVEPVRRNVINRVERLTGLRVTAVNTMVNDVRLPEEQPHLGRQREVERQAQDQERQA